MTNIKIYDLQSVNGKNFVIVSIIRQFALLSLEEQRAQMLNVKPILVTCAVSFPEEERSVIKKKKRTWKFHETIFGVSFHISSPFPSFAGFIFATKIIKLSRRKKESMWNGCYVLKTRILVCTVFTNRPCSNTLTVIFPFISPSVMQNRNW